LNRIYEGDCCYECGAYGTERHHCLPGPNRRKCEEDGLTVDLCHNCHMRLHQQGNDLMLKYKRLAQTEYEKSHTRTEYMLRYGRNYL